jgi:hypothetical protein
VGGGVLLAERRVGLGGPARRHLTQQGE